MEAAITCAKRSQPDLGCTRDHIILGSGSNEIIEFLGHAFLDRGDDVITSEHAFVAYKLVAAVFGARTIEVPSPDLRHDLDAMIAAITPKTRLIFVANPNNPTGTLAGQDEIDRFMERVPENVVVVFDEAYFEYLDNPPDTLRFVRAGRNVVVLRTFSKIQGLASLRIGYGIARPELIQVLQKTRQPFNVNGLAQAAALASLADDEHRRETKRITDEGRAYLQDQFRAMDLQFVPSAANFVLVKVGDGARIFRKLLERQIIVRALKGYNLAGVDSNFGRHDGAKSAMHRSIAGNLERASQREGAGSARWRVTRSLRSPLRPGKAPSP